MIGLLVLRLSRPAANSEQVTPIFRLIIIKINKKNENSCLYFECGAVCARRTETVRERKERDERIQETPKQKRFDSIQLNHGMYTGSAKISQFPQTSNKKIGIVECVV